ncbi:MAG: hypothetical protein GY929_12260, partial [Actinomycetia bacterium]|nr:hypothetical protein [Actinomycetes bacterium]
MSPLEPIVIPDWAQGRPGMGQGGFSAFRFAAAIGEPVAVNLRAPIPLLTPLNVVRTAAGWALLDGDTLIMDAVPRAEILGQFTST